MRNQKPSLCKTEGPLSICDCMNGVANIKDEQKRCQAYELGKTGCCAYYRSSIRACLNFDGYFSGGKIVKSY
jgi:hypothetical protein